MREFYDGLARRVARAAYPPRAPDDVSTLDILTKFGDDWQTHLGNALAASNVLIAVISPPYFSRPDCGREFGGFILRSPNLGIDAQGQLTGVNNVFLIRWMESGFYNRPDQKDGRIPSFIRRINDALPAPANANADPELAEAVRNYRQFGMELCVDKPYYKRLLNALVLAIVNATPLQPAAPQNWDDLIDAFRHDWGAHFNAAQAQPPELVPVEPLTSAVIVYVTGRSFQISPASAQFAARLIAAPVPDGTGTDPELGSLILDMQAAASPEILQALACVGEPVIPAVAAPMIELLADLSLRRVLPLLVIDAGTLIGQALPVLREIVDSEVWTGPVLIPTFPGTPADADQFLDSRQRPVYMLPGARDARRTIVTSILLNLRRQVTAAARLEQPVSGDPMPLLRGPGDSRR